MSYMFYNCSSLNNLPDISKWNTTNVNNMSSMFYYCESLNNLPDISKWNTTNVTDMSSMFYNCKSLNNLDLSFLNFKKINNINYMLYNCNNYKNLDLQEYYKSFNINTNNIFGSIMTIIYNINKNEIKLFGDNFVKNNKDNCYL